VECLFLEGHLRHTEESQQDDEVVYRCMTAAHQEGDNMGAMVYDLPSIILKSLNLSEMESGISRLSISGAFLHRTDDFHDVDRIIADEDSTVTVYDDQETRRKLAVRTRGTRNVIVVRVSGLDTEPQLSRSELETRFFDKSLTTFVSQYQRCSNGALNFVPATFQSAKTSISRGVGELTIQRKLIGEVMSPTIENELFVLFQNTFGDVDNYDNILYCLPSGLNQNWIGYTYGKTYRSYFNDEWCGYYTLPFHEVGHNLGLKHSGNSVNAYEDRSCLMGVSYSESFGKRMCFNAHKFFVLNWFPTRTVTVDPSVDGPWQGNLVAFVDISKIYDHDRTYVVVVNVGDLYMVYNRAKDYNDEVQEAKDKVSIVQANSTKTASVRVITLDTNRPSYSRQVRLGNGLETVVIELCREVRGADIDFYSMRIYIEGQVSSCDSSSRIRGGTLLMPAPSPEAAPSTLINIPSLSILCDDNATATFDVPNQNEQQGCAWLTIRPKLQHYLCRSGFDAFEVCRNTCSRCSTVCQDAPNEHFTVTGVDGTSVQRSCLWLSLRIEMIASICSSNTSEASVVCPATCHTCDTQQTYNPTQRSKPNSPTPAVTKRQPSSKPTVAPRLRPTTTRSNSFETSSMQTTAVLVDPNMSYRCTDSTGPFFISNLGEFQTCQWVAENFLQQQELCNQQPEVLHYCPKTCQACHVPCRDTFDTFRVGSVTRDCLWLSMRPSTTQNLLCVEGTVPYVTCPMTCHSCLF